MSFKKISYYVLLLTIYGFQVGFAQAPKQHKKLNIIYIMSDDHTTQAIGAYKSRLAVLNPTPNIDKLAAGGMIFNQVFVTNSICTPSRATILTGQYSQTNGVIDLDGSLSPEKQYLPKEMKKLGYYTAIIGKWHLHDEPKAFDYYKVLEGQGTYFNPKFLDKSAAGVWPNNIINTDGHSTDIITDAALDWLAKGRNKQKPFFFMLHYKAPHDDFEFAPRYAKYLENKEIPEPSSLYAQPNWGSNSTKGINDSLLNYIGSSVSNRHMYRNYVKFYKIDSTLDKNTQTHLAYQEYLKRYLRCVKGVDDNLKRLFDYLKKEGLWENTVIIYTGDQGMMLGEHDLQDKRWMYDESMRMPFIVHCPKLIKPKSSSDLLINNTDFAPTIIGLGGGQTPKYMQGMSFVNTLEGRIQNSWRESTYYRYWMHIIHHYVPSHFGVRTKDYKLIFFYGAHNLPTSEFKNFYWSKQYVGIENHTPAGFEFYDLRNDPEELNNRYNDPNYKDIIAKLKQQILINRENYNETDTNYPELEKIIKYNWNK